MELRKETDQIISFKKLNSNNDFRSQNRGTIVQYALTKLVSALLIIKIAVTTVKMREFVSQTEQKWLLIKFGQEVTQGAIATGR